MVSCIDVETSARERFFVLEVGMVALVHWQGLISLGTIALISATSLALAQDQTKTRQVPAGATDSSEQEFIIDNALALSKMSLAMTVDPTGDVDRDFVAIMMPHHQGALDMARAELKYGHNEELQRLARDIIAEREHEMSAMRAAVGEPPPARSSDTPATETNSEHPPSARIRE
jgi:hypothetical protein